MSRTKVLIFAVIFIFIVVGADKLLKIYSNNYEDNNIESGEKTNILSKVIEINLENFSGEVLESDKPVLIDFYATWCEPCKMLSPIVEEIALERDDIKVVKIDVDKETKLAYMYKVYSMPTLLVIENGIEKARNIGLVEKAAIEKMFEIKK